MQVAVAQADGFDGDVDKLGPRQVFLIDSANALRRILKFIDDDGRDDQLKAPGFDLGEELRARRFDPRIKDAALNGSVGVNTDGHVGMLGRAKGVDSRISLLLGRGAGSAVLAGSSNAANAHMGAWYLARLGQQKVNAPIVEVSIPTGKATELVWHVDIYQNPELQQLQLLVETARARLAEVEAAFSVDQRKVDSLRAKLFAKLREHFEQRDRLRLVIHYRKSFLETLLRSGEEEANEVREQFKQAEAETRREYESTAATLEKKRELTARLIFATSQTWPIFK